jgi:hypothetical protein
MMTSQDEENKSCSSDMDCGTSLALKLNRLDTVQKA